MKIDMDYIRNQPLNNGSFYIDEGGDVCIKALLLFSTLVERPKNNLEWGDCVKYPLTVKASLELIEEGLSSKLDGFEHRLMGTSNISVREEIRKDFIAWVEEHYPQAVATKEVVNV